MLYQKCFTIISILVCLITNTNSDPICQDCSQQHIHHDFKDRLFLVIGESLKGKSSFIKDITGEKVSLAQYGTGNSRSKEIKSYTSIKHLQGAIFIDTLGLSRSDSLNDEDIGSMLENYLITHHPSGELAGIILIESYLGDTSSIHRQVQFISEIFGRSVSESISIFITKKNLITDEAFCKKKKSSIKFQAKKLGIVSKILDIQTSYSVLPSISHQENQVQMIAEVLKSLKPIQLSLVSKRKEAMQKRAQQIQEKGRKTHQVKQSCIVGDGHGLDIFNSKKYVEEVTAYFEQYPSIQQSRRKAREQLRQVIKQSLHAS